MNAPEDMPSTGGLPDTNSFGTVTVIIEGKGDSPNEPLPPISKIWLAYERDRHANPNTPRPYRPYLEPPTTPPQSEPPAS